MSDLSQQNTESTVMAENTGVSLNCGYGNKVQSENSQSSDSKRSFAAASS